MQFAALSNRPETDCSTLRSRARSTRRTSRSSRWPTSSARTTVVLGTERRHGCRRWRSPTTPSTTFSSASVPVLLVLWFGVAGGLAFRRGRRLLTSVLVLALLFALGRYTPLFRWSFDWVPGINRFRRPVDGDFVLLIALAMLAGQTAAPTTCARDCRACGCWQPSDCGGRDRGPGRGGDVLGALGSWRGRAHRSAARPRRSPSPSSWR